MAHSWPRKSLNELYDFSSGLSKPRSAFGSGFPFLTFKDVFYNTFVPNDLGDLVASTDSERVTCDIKRGDVFLTRTSETMEELGMSCVALLDFPSATFNGFTKRLRPKLKDEIAPEFAGYFFRSHRFRGEVTAMSSQSTRASLNNDMLGRLKIPLPDLATQTRIASVLKSLDDKIEHNRRTAQALERLARAIFRAWFIDFEPVKAKAAGATSFPSMLQSVFDMMPTRLDDSEIGPIPAAWEVKSLADACTFVSGGTPKRSEPLFWNGQIPWYSVRDSPDCGAWVNDTEERITSFGIANSAARIVPAGCTIISARGTVGKLAMAGVPMAFNQSCYGLLPKDGEAFTYLYLLLQSVVANLQQRTHGSVFETITLSTFDQLKIINPSPGIVKLFEMVVSPYFGLSKALLQESVSLNKIRDYLLPLLLSGRVSVTSTNAGE